MNVVLNLDNKKIECDNGMSSSALSESEILILKLLSTERSAHSRKDILDYAWPDRIVSNNSLNVAVTNLRKCFSELGFKNAIHTIRGYGYKLDNHIQIQFNINDNINFNEEIIERLKENINEQLIVHNAKTASSEQAIDEFTDKPQKNSSAKTFSFDPYLLLYIGISLMVVIGIQVFL